MLLMKTQTTNIGRYRVQGHSAQCSIHLRASTQKPQYEIWLTSTAFGRIACVCFTFSGDWYPRLGFTWLETLPNSEYYHFVFVGKQQPNEFCRGKLPGIYLMIANVMICNETKSRLRITLLIDARAEVFKLSKPRYGTALHTYPRISLKINVNL